MSRRKVRPKLREPAYPQGSVVRLSPQAYFREFCERHGRWPVVWKGKLLFPDGWTYSRSDHSGPEWPPSKDEAELRGALSFYWRRRLTIVTAERDRVNMMLLELEQLQGKLSAPLQQVTGYWDAEAQGNAPGTQGAYVQQVGPVDFAGLRERLKWLQEDVRGCGGMVELVEADRLREALERAMTV